MLCLLCLLTGLKAQRCHRSQVGHEQACAAAVHAEWSEIAAQISSTWPFCVSQHAYHTMRSKAHFFAISAQYVN